MGTDGTTVLYGKHDLSPVNRVYYYFIMSHNPIIGCTVCIL